MTNHESPYDPEFTDPKFHRPGMWSDYSGVNPEKKDPAKLAETFRSSSAQYAELFDTLVTRLGGEIKSSTFDHELDAISENIDDLSFFLDSANNKPFEGGSIEEVARIDMARKIASADLTRAINQSQLPGKYDKDGFGLRQVEGNYVSLGRSTWQSNEFMPQSIEVHSYAAGEPVIVYKKGVDPGRNPSLEYLNQPEIPDPDINWLNQSLAESSLVMHEWLKLDDDQLKQTLKI